jgi:hypothetical protein
MHLLLATPLQQCRNASRHLYDRSVSKEVKKSQRVAYGNRTGITCAIIFASSLREFQNFSAEASALKAFVGIS